MHRKRSAEGNEPFQDVDDTQLAKVIRERDDLQSLLKKVERHMAEVKPVERTNDLISEDKF